MDALSSSSSLDSCINSLAASDSCIDSLDGLGDSNWLSDCRVGVVSVRTVCAIAASGVVSWLLDTPACSKLTLIKI